MAKETGGDFYPVPIVDQGARPGAMRQSLRPPQLIPPSVSMPSIALTQPSTGASALFLRTAVVVALAALIVGGGIVLFLVR